jgi:hypothetical protein
LPQSGCTHGYRAWETKPVNFLQITAHFGVCYS